MTVSDDRYTVTLHHCDPARNRFRYYHLSVQPNLFGAWSLIREWGRIGSPGRVRIDLCESLADARRAFDRKRLEKQKRGYVSGR
jgi:predicted DNA-binding WGR domain protein